MLLDTQASGNNRKITAFIGGLDLCDGRYDTPQHRIFKDLDTVFEGDYHQPTFPVSGFPVTSWNIFFLFYIGRLIHDHDFPHFLKCMCALVIFHIKTVLLQKISFGNFIGLASHLIF